MSYPYGSYNADTLNILNKNGCIIGLTTKSGNINLKKVKPGTKTLSSVGPGIFAESRLDNNKEVLMNIGASVVVKKSILSAKTTISNKVEKINELMKQLQKEIESVNGNLQKLSRDLIESER